MRECRLSCAWSTDVSLRNNLTATLCWNRFYPPSNLNAAYKQVMRNKGAAGIDRMDCASLLGYLLEQKDALTERIRQRTYRPNPVRRVEIPKDNGKKRLLGIPTVVDRMIQQAIAQELTPIYEGQFSDGSFGFRPKRGSETVSGSRD